MSLFVVVRLVGVAASGCCAVSWQVWLLTGVLALYGVMFAVTAIVWFRCAVCGADVFVRLNRPQMSLGVVAVTVSLSMSAVTV